MARVFGGNAKCSFDGSEINDELDSLTLAWSVPTGNVTAFADVYQVAVAGKKSTTLDISGTFDATDDQADDRLDAALNTNTTKTVIVLPGGGSVGADNPAYTCTASGLTGAIVTRLTENYPVGDAAKFTSSMVLSGSTTRATS